MEVGMAQESCISCGFAFQVPAAFMANRRRDHKGFYCPACGNSLYYPAKSDLEKMRERAARLERELGRAREEAEYLEHCRRATKGVVTKLQKKLAAATTVEEA